MKRCRRCWRLAVAHVAVHPDGRQQRLASRRREGNVEQSVRDVGREASDHRIVMLSQRIEVQRPEHLLSLDGYVEDAKARTMLSYLCHV